MSDYDVVVVGGGLAALSAAWTIARLDRKTLILTGGVPGGELLNIEKIDGVPGFPDGVPGYDLGPIAQEQADGAGVAFITEMADAIEADGDLWRVTGPGGAFTARGLIVATGAGIARLGVPGEERLHGKGVSHCATCDGPLLRNRIVVVAGGGDSAMQEAMTLAQHVSKVIMVERSDALTGQRPYREEVLANPEIEVRYGEEVVEVLGDDAVTAIKVKDVASGAESEIEAAGLFAFVGLTPNNAIAGDLLPLDAGGRIRVDAGMRTPLPGICAAGNVRQSSPHRAAGAMGDGAAAAVSIDAYLRNGAWGATA